MSKPPKSRSTKKQLFIKAVSEGNGGEAERYLVGKRIRVDTVDEHGDSALIVATNKGFVAMVKLLLEHRANVHYIGHDGQTVFNIAAGRRNKEIMNLLLESGASVSPIKKLVSAAAGSSSVDLEIKNYISSIYECSKRWLEIFNNKDTGKTIVKQIQELRKSYDKEYISDAVLFNMACGPKTYTPAHLAADYLIKTDDAEPMRYIVKMGGDVYNKNSERLSPRRMILSVANPAQKKFLVEIMTDIIDEIGGVKFLSESKFVDFKDGGATSPVLSFMRGISSSSSPATEAASLLESGHEQNLEDKKESDEFREPLPMLESVHEQNLEDKKESDEFQEPLPVEADEIELGSIAATAPAAQIPTPTPGKATPSTSLSPSTASKPGGKPVGKPGGKDDGCCTIL